MFRSTSCHVRWYSLLLCGCLLLSALLCACSGSNEKKPGVTTPEVTTTIHPETEADTITPPEQDRFSAPIRYLLDRHLIAEEDVRMVQEDVGTLMILTVSLGTILERGGITELPRGEDTPNPVSRYADWYLYTLDDTCSLFYMRTGTQSSGAGVSFIELDFRVIQDCLDSGVAVEAVNEALLSATKASESGRHNPVLTAYFENPLSDGAYLIADAFVDAVASESADSVLPAPAHYATCSAQDAEFVRVTEALRYLDELHPGLILWENDRPNRVSLGSREALTPYEKQAILTLYTMDVTFCSFAAEVAVHAKMCAQNFLGSYDRCKIADMAVGTYSNTAGALARWENEFGFYNLNSTAVKSQEEHHPTYKGEYDPASPLS